MGEASSLETTKTVLRSLLISSPEALTVHRLNSDYKHSEGKDIPFAKLGYATLQSFLNSMPDVLTYNPYTSLVKPVLSQNSKNAHVHKFVSEQKPSRRNNSRRSSNNNNSSNQNYRRNGQQSQSSVWDRQPIMYNQRHGLNFNMNGGFSYQSQPQKFEPGNLLAMPNTFMPNQYSILGQPPNIQPLFIPRSVITNRQRPRNTKEMIKKNPSPNTSRLTVDREKNGSKKLNGHVGGLEDSRSDSGDSKKHNGHVDASEDSRSDSSTAEVDALPPMDDDDPIMFLGTSLKYGTKIPPATLPKNLKAGEIYQIFVTEITAVPHFYFQFHESQCLMSEIQEQLRYEDDLAQKIEQAQIRVGNVCAAFFSDQWLRAEILTNPDENLGLKLLFVDFGTIEYVSIEYIRHLKSELCEIPRLCHRGALDFIKPVNDYKMERKIVKFFCEMVTDRSLMAVISKIDEDNTISMTLVDTRSLAEDIIVNKVLMESFPATKRVRS